VKITKYLELNDSPICEQWTGKVESDFRCLIKVLFRNLPGGTKKIMDTLTQDKQYGSRYSNLCTSQITVCTVGPASPLAGLNLALVIAVEM
jgi:hypothetical protein